MLRPEIVATTPENQPHLVAYWRRFAPQNVLDALQASGREVRVYGLGSRPRSGNLVFHAISEQRFLEDLASSSALVSTAGNQLVGEALFLGKPVLAFPESRNFEQYINAHFLDQSGAGAWAEMEQVSAAHISGFLGRLDEYRARIHRSRMNGLPVTLAALSRHLPAPGTEPRVGVQAESQGAATGNRPSPSSLAI